MKIVYLNALLCFIIFTSCSKSNPQVNTVAAKENIILVGADDIFDPESAVPFMYEGSKKTNLETTGSGSCIPYKVFVDGNNIYVLGFTYNQPVSGTAESILLWKNGKLESLSNHEGYVIGSTRIDDIYLKGSDLYALGSNVNMKYIWKNGKILYQKNLPYHDLDGILEIDNSGNVYFSYEYRNPGSCLINSTNNSTCSVLNGIFKNNFLDFWSQTSQSSSIPGYSYKYSYPNALHFNSRGDYLILNSTTNYMGLAPKSKQIEWIRNGTQQYYLLAPPINDQLVEINGTYLSNDSLFTSGSYKINNNTICCYWVNSTPVLLNEALIVFNIISKNGNIYLAGVDKTNPSTVFWKNGKPMSVEGINNFNCTYIYVK